MTSLEFPAGSDSRPELREQRIDPADVLFIQALQPSAATTEQVISRIDEVFAQATQSATTHQERAVLTLLGDISKWRLFGNEDGMLPEGLVRVEGEPFDNAEYDPRLGLTKHNVDMATDTLLAASLRDADLPARDNIELRKPEITASMQALVLRSQAYALVQSFATEPPQPTSEQPLSELTRQTIESTLIQQALRQTGATSLQTLPADSPVWWRLKRNLAGLEIATEPARSTLSASQEAISRVVGFFGPKVVEAAGEQQTFISFDEESGEIDNDDRTALILNLQDGDWFDVSDGVDDNAFGFKVSEEISKNFADTSLVTGRLGCHFLANFIYEVLKPSSRKKPFQEVVAEAVDTSVEELFRHYNANIAERLPWTDYVVLPRLAITMDREPRLSHEEFKSAEALVNAALPQESFTTTSLDEILRLKRKVIGELKRMPASSPVRLVKRGKANLTLPSTVNDDSEAIRLVLYDEDGTLDPQIPGYRLTFRDLDRMDAVYGFTPLEHDPYNISGITLPTDNLPEVLEQYRTIGLNALAKAVSDAAASGELQLKDLQKLLYRYGDYAAPSDTSYHTTHDILDFQSFVRDEFLEIQCDGAACFAKATVAKLLPDCEPTIIGGTPIEGGEPLTAQKHAQLQITLLGREYIIDTTPALQRFIPPARLRTRDNPRRRPKAETQPPIELTREERLRRALGTLELQLCNITRASNTENMHRIVSNLPKTDPLRQALWTFARAHGGLAGHEDAVRLVDYLDHAAAADGRTRRKHRIADYDETTFGLLGAAARGLAALYTEEATTDKAERSLRTEA